MWPVVGVRLVVPVWEGAVLREGAVLCDGVELCDWVDPWEGAEECDGALECGAEGALGGELVFFWPQANAGIAIKMIVEIHCRTTFLLKLITAS